MPPEDVLAALRAARADAVSTTNFGPYDELQAQGLSASQWFVRMLAQVALMIAATLLAGMFLFPMDAHAKWSCAETAAQPGGSLQAMSENSNRLTREVESKS
ncbi:MAG: hypothetical protein ABWZ88_14045 [Variovorax sp.]